MTLIFATNNLHKLSEIRSLIPNTTRILGLSEAGFEGEIPEDFPTLEQNASQKAWYIYKKLGQNCFADDTGLEVNVLNGEPGAYSARYSTIGELRFPELEIVEGNIKKLLEMMRFEVNRHARFRTVIALVINGVEFQFEGIVTGTIAKEKKGSQGFGYDPVFIPDGMQCSFGEMNLEEKNKISHRGIAVGKFVNFLNSNCILTH